MPDTEFRQILTSHLTRYPAMQVQDVYKLLHQAALGSEHAFRDEQAARDWLEHELAEMGDGPDDPLMDPLSPDGQTLRVHLRPYLRAGKNPETLLRAFIQTANEWRGSPEKLKEYGAAAAQLAQTGTGSIRREGIEAFFSKMEEQDFPAVHHSEVYERLYRPAYRVVARQFMEEK
ncbi:MAG: hypothetical protein Q8N46_00355 [Anaerolineales bacterium]|nr:hypothetical protein [Anaerolineales bacterium]